MPNLTDLDPFKLKMMNLLMDDKIMQIKFGTDMTYSCIVQINMDKLREMCGESNLQD